jgi:hypothetical protein
VEFAIGALAVKVNAFASPSVRSPR